MATEAVFDLRPKKFCQRCGEFHAEDQWQEGCERYLGGKPIRKCKVCGGDHPLDRWPGNCIIPDLNDARSDLPAPMIIRDGLPDMLSMHDGKRYDSKSAYYRSLRAGGCEIVDSKEPEFDHRPAKSERALDNEFGQTVKDTLEQLRSDSLSNDQMNNMLREKHESQGGFHVEG